MAPDIYVYDMVNQKSSWQLSAMQYIYHQMIFWKGPTAVNHKKNNNVHKKFGGNIRIV